MTDKKKKRRRGLRVDIIALVSLLIMLITFFAYMLNTSLEEVLEKERGSGVIITHTENDTADSTATVQAVDSDISTDN